MRKETMLVASAPVTIDVCANCSAVFVDYYEEARGVARQRPKPSDDAKRETEATCPDCHAAMALFPYEGNGPNVLTCSGCLGMHVDVAAQQALREWVRRAPKAPDELSSILDHVLDFLSKALEH